MIFHSDIHTPKCFPPSIHELQSSLSFHPSILTTTATERNIHTPVKLLFHSSSPRKRTSLMYGDCNRESSFVSVGESLHSEKEERGEREQTIIHSHTCLPCLEEPPLLTERDWLILQKVFSPSKSLSFTRSHFSLLLPPLSHHHHRPAIVVSRSIVVVASRESRTTRQSLSFLTPTCHAVLEARLDREKKEA